METAKKQRNAYKDWMRAKKKSDGNSYSENTINTYISSLSSAPAKLTGVNLETNNLFEICSSEVFKVERVKIENAENFNEINEKAGNKAFQYALEYYLDLLVQQEQKKGKLNDLF